MSGTDTKRENKQDLLINRDLSWLEFNRRVLEEAKDPSVPLLERVKFLAIFSSNLDEFFMVRVAHLKHRTDNSGTTSNGITGASALTAISQKVHELVEEQHLCFLETVLPQLTAEGIHLLRPEEISREQEQFLEDYFRKTLYPIVTPLAICRVCIMVLSFSPRMPFGLRETRNSPLYGGGMRICW